MDIKKTAVVLASSSKYRQKLLSDYGLACQAVAPLFDEEKFKSSDLGPQPLCEKLGYLKAESLVAKYPDSIIIGADQLIHFEGRIIGKAGNAEAATKQLLELSDKTHDLITSLTVFYNGNSYTETNITKLTMRPLTSSQAEQFVNREQSWDCAGSYKLEKSGASLFSHIQTTDHSAIIGLPLTSLTDILLKIGFQLPLFKD